MRFIENMSVGRKLAVAFGVVLAAIAVMGVVVVTNLLALQRADHARNLEGEINQVLAVAEGWHRGPTHAPVADPTTLGPVVEELLAKARPNAGMDGRDGSWPQPQAK